jgi:hypothetical protein
MGPSWSWRSSLATDQVFNLGNPACRIRGVLNRSFIGNIEQLPAGLAVYSIAIMSSQTAVQTAKAHFRRVKKHLGKIQEQRDTEDHDDQGGLLVYLAKPALQLQDFLLGLL